MTTPASITQFLRRLCALEHETNSTLSKSLTPEEKRHEIARLRGLIPLSILGHHDRMLQRNKPSIVPARNGVCAACHLRLPKTRVNHLIAGKDLEVCDNCGVFLYCEEAPVKKVVQPKTTRRLAVSHSA